MALLCVWGPGVLAEGGGLLEGAKFNRDYLSKIRFGLVCPGPPGEKVPAPGTALGYVEQRAASQKVEFTTLVIPMKPGVAFGVGSTVAGLQNLDEAQIIIRHPAYKGTDITEESWISEFTVNSNNLNFFVFEHDFEMVLGEWSIEASYEGELLYSVTFQVVDPALFPGPSKLCQDLLLS